MSKKYNLNALANSIRICRVPREARELEPFLIPDAEGIAQRVFDAPESAWHDWIADPPNNDAGEIVGRDALGYCHLATHLIGSDGMWVESWMSVPFSSVAI